MATPTWLTKKQLKVFEDLLEEMGIVDYSVQFSPELEVGKNFMGNIIRAEVKKTDDTSEPSHFIIKCSPLGDNFWIVAPVKQCFDREIYVYSKVFPEFVALQKRWQVSAPFKSYPILYKYFNEYREEMLIFENVKFSRFKHYPRNKCLDYNHVLLILQEYARFHALSYALRDQKPDLFKEMASHMGDTFFEHFTRESFYSIALHRIEETLKALNPVKDKLVYDHFKQFSKTMFPKLIELMDLTTPYDVFAHIDTGISNFLFKYKDSEAPCIPTEVCILDFQISRLSSPAVDLCCFLFSDTDKTVRERYDELILKYYNCFCAFLEELGSDGRKLLPFNVLQAHLKEYGIVGLFWAIHILYVQCTIAQSVPSIFENESYAKGLEFIYEIEDRSVFDERVRDSVLDFHRFGYNFI
ncbi:hypothetical protein RI129_005050 [Pyrocoelia pectoralis]|uniref:CHK kinase-like domain-containing protein n=1 Tax=Pyrocoelia pectoralis TaxID=417401 RepID=A0AAN7VJD7_9COLE